MVKAVSHTFATGIIALSLVLVPAGTLHKNDAEIPSADITEPVYMTAGSGGVL